MESSFSLVSPGLALALVFLPLAFFLEPLFPLALDTPAAGFLPLFLLDLEPAFPTFFI